MYFKRIQLYIAYSLFQVIVSPIKFKGQRNHIDLKMLTLKDFRIYNTLEADDFDTKGIL